MNLTTIVIPVFNKLEYTKTCLSAIAKNTPAGRYELVLVDNASTDGTAEYFQKLSADNIATVITNEQNAGFTLACNQGAQCGQGEYVLFLNNDTEPRAGWLESMVELMITNPRIGIVGSKLVYPDGRLQEAGGIIFRDGSGWNYGRFGSPDDPSYNYVREVDYVSGASLLIRRALLAELGYFDEQYSPGYYEDTDLCFGARSKDFKVMYCPFSVVLHHEGISSGTDLTQGMKKHQVINREKFIKKWSEALKRQYPPDAKNAVLASERGSAGNILIIDALLPMFDRASGSLRLFTLVSLLRDQGYHVTFIARNGQGQETYADILRKMGVEVHATDPDMMRQMGYEVRARKIDLKKILEARQYHVAVLSFYNIALQYLFAIRVLSPQTKIIIDSVDIHFVREKRQAELADDTALLEWSKVTKNHELFIYSKADAIITVTEQDWDHIREDLPGKPHFVIPNIHTTGDGPIELADRSGLLFIGNFNHPPNADAVKFFLTDIYPEVVRKLPGTTLTIAGNNPPSELLALKNKAINVTGYVPSTEPYLRKARVSIAPLRYGAGMKGKIGEAMAHGLPVVTTSIGAEGMGLVSGETALIADNPREFADHIASLCRNDDLWRILASAGQQLILNNYSPQKVALQLADMLRCVESLVPLKLTTVEQALISRGGRVITKELVSIIILTFNQIKYTKECVESIRKNTPEPHELVFVDNGSTDGTVQWLRQLVKNRANWRLIENRKNLGFAKGCNQGIEASSGEYVLLLNNDVVVTKNWLSGMLACLRSEPDAGIVGPMTNSISGPQKVGRVTYESVSRLDEYAGEFRKRNERRRIPLRRIVGFCMLFKRSLVDAIGLLDESFGTGNFEDDDYCLRATLLGHRNIIAGDVFLHHYGSMSFVGNRIHYGSALTGNRKIFTEKWSAIDAQSELGKRVAALTALEKAREFHERGDIDKAVGQFLESMRCTPENSNIPLELAGLLIDNKQFSDALVVLDAAPSSEESAHHILLTGYCKEGLGLMDEADEKANKALSRDPSSALALNLKGLVAYKKENKPAADEFFRKAAEADPGYGEPYTNRGMLLWAAGRRAEAVELFERAFILTPAAFDIATAYHSAITTEGLFERAELVLREAKDLHPLNRRIAFLLIDVLIRQNKHADAMHEIEQAMMLYGIDDGILDAALEVRSAVGPHSGKSADTLSLCMIVKNEEANLLKCLMSVKALADEIIVVDTGSGDRTKKIAQALGAKTFDFPWTGDFSTARNFSLARATGNWVLVLDADEVIAPQDHARLVAVIGQRTSKPTAYALVTRNYIVPIQTTGWTTNDGVYAQEEAGTGWFPSIKVRLFPRDTRIRFVNPVHELVESSLKALGIAPKDLDVPVHHYGKLDTKKDKIKGEEYYVLGRKKLEETGENAAALRELAIQAGGLQKFDEALGLWQRALPLITDQETAYLNMASLYLQMDRFSEALAVSRKAIERNPGLKEAVCNNALCELYAGDVERAVRGLEKLLAAEPEYPSARIMLAIAYLFQGNREKGIAQFLRLRIMSSNLAEAILPFARKLAGAGRPEYALLLLDAAIEQRAVNDEILALRRECAGLVAHPISPAVL